MDQEQSKISVAKVIKLILIVAGILIICTALFAFFKIKIDAKAALRDAKNVEMALESVDIEMYGQNKTIYDPTKVNGITDGVVEKTELIYKSEGSYSITSYNKSKRELGGMSFRKGRYIVYYKRSNGIESWNVDFIMSVYSFEDEE